MVVGDGRGRVFEVPGLSMAGMSGGLPVVPDKQDLIEIPYGSQLMELPGRTAVGFDADTGACVEVGEVGGRRVAPVAVFMAPAYVQLLTAAYRETPEAPRLPLYAYTAVGWRDGRFYAAGRRIDRDTRSDPALSDCRRVERGAGELLRRYPGNRLVAHLVNNCVRKYDCGTARNMALGRSEWPVPTSRRCNASCLGCLSLQRASSGVTASHERIRFTPTVDEIVEYAAPHLERNDRAIVTFGQGCEGEPLTEAPLIAEAIGRIRAATRRGAIAVNTNAGSPERVELLCRAGLDSIRVSLSSARPRLYEAYFRPRDYGFGDVVESLRRARAHGLWTSINYFVFPGFTDDPCEIEALDALIDDCKIDMIQTRNLNIDPLWLLRTLGLAERAARGIGMRAWIAHVRARHPDVRLGYFNPPAEIVAAHRRARRMRGLR